MDTVLLAMSRSMIIIEGAIGAVVVLLLIGILMTSRRRKNAASKPAPEVPNYYADLQQQPATRSDPFGAFASAPAPAAPPPLVTSSVATEHGAVAPGNGFTVPQGSAPPGAGSAWPSADAWSLGGFAPDAGAATVGAQSPTVTATVAPPQPAAALQVVTPSAGTPAGWLPDPGGAPDTLRYWDGNAWTQHYAQRS
jgi:hypothetical protein